ncbi:MAG: hypothetical protein HYS73_00960 [Parcubacteria group bacterium]|nr:hypothetical protein [Parcubacteria group bacterium]
MPPQAPYQQQQNNPPFNQPFNQPAGGDSFNKPMLWLIIGGAALFVIIAVALFFGSGLGKSEDEIKAEILRSLSAPSNAPEISAEEKQQILESLSAPSNAPEISAEEKQRILESLSAPSQ